MQPTTETVLLPEQITRTDIIFCICSILSFSKYVISKNLSVILISIMTSSIPLLIFIIDYSGSTVRHQIIRCSILLLQVIALLISICLVVSNVSDDDVVSLFSILLLFLICISISFHIISLCPVSYVAYIVLCSIVLAAHVIVLILAVMHQIDDTIK